jgi:hypothetical protein
MSLSTGSLGRQPFLEEPRFRVFQALFYVDSKPGIEKSLRKQLTRWLDEKGFLGLPLEDSGFFPREGRELRFVHSVSSDGISYQAKLAETTASGTWRSTFTFSIPRNRQERSWLLIRISNDEGYSAKPPRLLRYLVEEGLVIDGSSPLPLEAQIYRSDMLEQLFAEIADPLRRTPLFLAATDTSQDFDTYAIKAKAWAGKLAGLARFVILDPIASSRFLEVLGEEYSVPVWTVRSYLPGVANEDTFDSRRHKILGLARLQEPVARVRGTLERISRGVTHQEVFPNYVNVTLRRLQRLEDKQMVEAITHESASEIAIVSAVEGPNLKLVLPESPKTDSVSDQASEYLAKVTLVEQILGISEINQEALELLVRNAKSGYVAQAALDSMTKEFTLRQNLVDELEVRNNELEQDISDLDGNVGQLEDENRNLVERVRSLEKRNEWLLRQADDNQRYSTEYLEIEMESSHGAPKNWEEFISKIRDFEDRGIFFTGDVKDALEIEQNDDWGNIVRSAWDCVQVLVEYRDSRISASWVQGLDEFIRASGTFPARKHARNETGWTRRQGNRDFPVPLTVSETGLAAMYAHFKLGKKGRVDPRMYYLDNFLVDEKIYIGYVGVHLKGRLT